MTTSDVIISILIIPILLFAFIGGITVFNAPEVIEVKNKAIAECEAQLPRHQNCGWRIETYVIEEKGSESVLKAL